MTNYTFLQLCKHASEQKNQGRRRRWSTWCTIIWQEVVTETGLLQFFVKVVPHGSISRHMWKRCSYHDHNYIAPDWSRTDEWKLMPSKHMWEVVKQKCLAWTCMMYPILLWELQFEMNKRDEAKECQSLAYILDIHLLIHKQHRTDKFWGTNVTHQLIASYIYIYIVK